LRLTCISPCTRQWSAAFCRLCSAAGAPALPAIRAVLSACTVRYWAGDWAGAPDVGYSHPGVTR
jgi:hypothetical protein